MNSAPLPRLPARRRGTVGEERQLALLNAIEGLLRERPLAEISIGDITAAAGVTRSGFYFYFPSKGAAVTELLGGVFTEMIAGAAEFIGGSGDARAGVRAAMVSTWTLWHEHEGVILAMLDARGGDPAVRELWDAWIERFVDPIAGGLERRRRSGHAPGGPDARELVRVLLSANVGTFERLSRATPGAGEIEPTIDALAAVWSGAVYGHSGEEIR